MIWEGRKPMALKSHSKLSVDGKWTIILSASSISVEVLIIKQTPHIASELCWLQFSIYFPPVSESRGFTVCGVL